MKKLVLAVSLALAATAAQADVVSANGKLAIVDASGITFTSGGNSFQGQALVEGAPVVKSVGDDGWGGNGSTLQPANLYEEGTLGMMVSTVDTKLAFTFLGKVAGYDNQFQGAWIGSTEMDDSTVGTTTTLDAVAGERIVFGFVSDQWSGNSALDVGNVQNGWLNDNPLGGTLAENAGIMYFDATAWNAANGDDYDFLIGYNDPAFGNADFDDYVVGVKAVPVPAALPLMASALGMFGIARRRKSA